MGPIQCFWVMKEARNGHGLFAALDIPAGTRIIQEQPLVTVTKQEGHSAQEHVSIPGKIGLLSAKDRGRFMELYHSPSKLNEFAEYQGKPCPANASDVDSAIALAKFYTNAATISTGDLQAGLFPTFCRMNHSCRPNTSWVYNDVSGMMEVYTSRNVKQDEELTDAYTEVARPRAWRSKELSNWGFQCACPVCDGPQAEEHEKRRCKIWQANELLALYEERSKKSQEAIPVFAEIPKTDLEALRLAEDVASLSKMEGLIEELGAAYGQCAKFARAAGLVDVADEYDEKEFQILVITTGDIL